jgi:hypothetical protein
MLQTFSHSCLAWQPFHFFSPRSVPRASEDQHKWIMQNNDEQTAEHASIFRRPKRNKQTATKLTQKSIWQKDSSYIVQIEVGKTFHINIVRISTVFLLSQVPAMCLP